MGVNPIYAVSAAMHGVTSAPTMLVGSVLSVIPLFIVGAVHQGGGWAFITGKLAGLRGIRARILLGGLILLLLTGTAITTFSALSPCKYYLTNFEPVPSSDPGLFNVALVVSGSSQDQGWSQSHAQSLVDLQKIQGVNAVLIEQIPELCDTTPVFSELARGGFQLVFGADFGYMDAMQSAAGEYPETSFINVLGYKKNNTNFDNLNGALEEVMYLGGMLAGARAAQDGNPRLGYIGTVVVPEQMRWANAAARGMRRFCPTCTMQVRWLDAWQDPRREKALAQELYKNGARVVISASSSGDATLAAAREGTAWGIVTGLRDVCTSRECLTAAYWNWSVVYGNITRDVMRRTYRPVDNYFHADSGGLGLFGFMPGEGLQPGLQDLPPDIINQIAELYFRMRTGDRDALMEVFTGPINDNAGKERVPVGVILDRHETDQFPPGPPGQKCQYCMCWWVEGIETSLPEVCNN